MFHSPCCISTPSPAPAESTVSEGQGVSRTNAPPPANHPQTSPSYLTPLPALPELPPLGQQNTEPTSFGSVTIDPSLLSEPVDGLPPATDFEPGVSLCVLSMHVGYVHQCLHKREPCGFSTFLSVSVATNVTARDARVTSRTNFQYSRR